MCVKAGREQERVDKGFCMRRVVRWSSRSAVTVYSQLHTGKGRLTAWRLGSGQEDMWLGCRYYYLDTGTHAALGCTDEESFGQR